MNATNVRPLNQTAPEGVQEALTWGVAMEMIDAVAEEATIGEATEAEAGTAGASEGAGVVGTEVALALARWTPGVTTDRTAGRGPISLPLEARTAFLLHPVLPPLFCNLPTPDHPRVFVSDYVIVTIFLDSIKNHRFS